MKDLFEWSHTFIRGGSGEGLEERRHVGLPAGVDGVVLHGGVGLVEVLRLAISDEEAIGTQV